MTTEEPHPYEQKPPKSVRWKSMEMHGGDTIILDDFAVVKRVEGCPDKIWEIFTDILMNNNDSMFIENAYEQGFEDGTEFAKAPKQ